MQRLSASFIIGLVGLAIGIFVGLYYAWKVDPRVQTNTAPWQLSADGQRDYMIAVSLSYAHDHDLARTVERLQDLRLGAATWQTLAKTACDLARTSFVSTNTGLTAVRNMVQLAQSQGATDCASTMLPLYTNTPAPTPTVVTPTPSLIPPATKTPTLGPTFTPATPVTPEITSTPSGAFRIALLQPVCDPRSPGMIEFTVQDVDGAGIPGIPVQVSTDTGKDNFFTGLKSERGAGYADYQMTAGNTYTVSLPGLSDPTQALDAKACNVAPADGGGKSTTSYRITFRRAAQ